MIIGKLYKIKSTGEWCYYFYTDIIPCLVNVTVPTRNGAIQRHYLRDIEI